MAVQKKSAKATPQRFVADVKKMRERARRHMQSGAVTESYRADRAQVIKVLNDVLATEIVCILRYKSHFYFSKGLDAEPARAEFLQHAGEEQQHADWVAERITQLGGEPNFDPKGLPERSHSEYGRHSNLITMIQEDLIAERVAIESYSEIIRWLGDDDMTTRRLMEDILKTEEEHADDMANLLAKVS
ncbi:MAG TPA: ferritin-like domain-containing protein [Candidatus Binataceae bacterium]|jgi:bacterioferritin|nr:ferritin-like domain-containing protein [Candidatus Binataceae bacterium]